MSIIQPSASQGSIIQPTGQGGSQITPQAPTRPGSIINPTGGGSIQPTSTQPAPAQMPGVSFHENVVNRTQAKIQEQRDRQEEHLAELWSYLLWEEKTRDEIEGKKKWDEMDKEEGDTRFRQVLDKFKDRLKEGGIDIAKEITIKSLEQFSKRVLSKMESKFAKMGAGVLERVLPKLNQVWSKSIGKIGQIDTALLLTDLVSSALVEATGIYSSRSHPAWTHDVENIPILGSLVSTSFNLGNIIAVALGLEKSDAQIQKESALRYLDDFSKRIHGEIHEKIGQLDRRAEQDQARLDSIDAVLGEEYEAQAESLGLISVYGLQRNTPRSVIQDLSKKYVEAKAPDYWSKSYKDAVAREISYFSFIELNPESPQAKAYEMKVRKGDFIGV